MKTNNLQNLSGGLMAKVKLKRIFVLGFFALCFLFTGEANAQGSYWKNYFSSEEQRAVQKNAERYTISEIESKSEKWKGLIRSFNIKNGSIKDEDIKENGIGTDKISGLGDYIDEKISQSSTPQTPQDFSADRLTGAYAALNGSQITDLNPSNITGGGNLNISEGNYYLYNGVNLAYANTTLSNYFFGNAGNLTMAGHSNTASGMRSLSSNTTGYENTALGLDTLYYNTSGFKNVAIGKNVLKANTIANGNTAAGWHSMYSNTVGNTNSAFGRETLAKNTEGISNVAIGFSALYFNLVGSYNTAVGAGALTYSGLEGAVTNNNTALGYYAGNRISSGSNNIALGYRAGDVLTTGANNIIIGYDIDLPAASSSNMLNIGNLIYGVGVDGAGTTVSSGNVGIGTADPKTKLEVDGIIKTKKRAAATCDADSEGGIYYDSDDKHFYGCNGTVWVQLDT